MAPRGESADAAGGEFPEGAAARSAPRGPDELERDEFIWLVGSICNLHAVPFDAPLLARNHPPPHDLAQVERALDACGLAVTHRSLEIGLQLASVGDEQSPDVLGCHARNVRWLRIVCNCRMGLPSGCPPDVAGSQRATATFSWRCSSDSPIDSRVRRRRSPISFSTDNTSVTS